MNTARVQADASLASRRRGDAFHFGSVAVIARGPQCGLLSTHVEVIERQLRARSALGIGLDCFWYLTMLYKMPGT